MKLRTLFLFLAALLLIAGILLMNNFLLIGGRFYPRNAEVLDLRETALTVKDYEQIRTRLPDCQIQWLVPFQGSSYPQDTKTLTVTALTEADAAALAYLPQLETVHAQGCRDYAALLALQARYPHCQVCYTLELEGTVFSQDTTVARLTTAEAISTALQYLPRLTQIDARGCRDYAALEQLQAQYPQVDIQAAVTLGGQEFPLDAAAITVLSTTAQELSQALPWLSRLQSVTVVRPMADPESMLALVKAYPQVAFTYSFELLGRTVNNRALTLDFSRTPLENTDALEAALPHFTALESVDLCGCGIADEAMAALNRRHPGIRFVWEIYICQNYIRTDVTTFMPYKLGHKLTDSEADKLKYLTELVCLDLGHMPVTRSDFLAYMPKMKYLILAPTGITDISGITVMQELVFLELFMTPIRDFSPLLECKSLVDLNVSYTAPSDPLLFGQMKQLKNLWFLGMSRGSTQDALQQLLPNTTMQFRGISATGYGWRQLDNYYAMRDVLEMPYGTY